jgi:uncharacterized membrane protein YhaH (DUF805 family)
MKPIGRLPFTGIGVGLAALKIGLDYAVAKAFSHPYSLLYYVSPMDAPLFHPGDQTKYYAAMWGVALPFIAIGVWLTVRRLIDAALSPWLALLFFAPFANLIFFALCAFAPSRPGIAENRAMPEQPIYRESGKPVTMPTVERRPAATLLMSAGLGAVVSLGILGISVGVLKEYGAALMIGSPTISGFATGAFIARLEPTAKFKRAAQATLVSCLVTFAVIVAFAVEGLVCMAMALPLILPPAFLGAYIGFQMGRAVGPKRVPAAIVGGILSLPLIFALEKANPLPALQPAPVATDITIDAPRERVFPLIERVADMGEPTETLFRVGISYPIRATLDDDRVGAVRRCEFNTGTALETVTVLDAPNHFAFHIDSQPDPMREATLYQGPRQPHLDGYVRNVEGIFDLESTPDGKTHVTAKSVYRVSMTPEWYWRLWSDEAIHTIHERVLTHVKARAEASDPTRLAAR